NVFKITHKATSTDTIDITYEADLAGAVGTVKLYNADTDLELNGDDLVDGAWIPVDVEITIADNATAGLKTFNIKIVGVEQ
ncbi:MAG: hypothetical protein K0R39_3775, partial [Symbiobacteriaceae bacterium]|nr:hypothetical protein [Symbiobacteriaceae bacterium]